MSQILSLLEKYLPAAATWEPDAPSGCVIAAHDGRQSISSPCHGLAAMMAAHQSEIKPRLLKIEPSETRPKRNLAFSALPACFA